MKAVALVCVVMSSAVVVATLGCGGAAPGPAPTLVSVVPSTGFTPGGAELTLRGSGFLAGGTNTVWVGAVSATDVVVLDDATLRCTLPAGAVGTASVEVRNENGTATLPDAFTYYGFPPNFLGSDVHVDSDDTTNSNNVVMCRNGPNVYLAWTDWRHGGGDVYFSRSTDGGVSWRPTDLRIETDSLGAANSWVQGICCDGDAVYVVWWDARNGDPDVYFTRSLDGGQTWLESDVRLNTDPAGSAVCRGPRICCDGGNVYVVWYDERNGRTDIYFNRSTDSGSTWLASDRRLDTDDPGVRDSSNPAICCSGSDVYVVWRDHRNLHSDVFLNRSTDGGATWLASDVRVNTDAAGADHRQYPQVCCAGANVYVAWEDGRNGGYDIYFNRSTDRGATWLADDTRLETSVAGATGSSAVQLCCHGRSVYVVWQDGRDGSDDIYFNRSLDAGSTWLSDDQRLDTDGPGDSYSSAPQICCAGQNVYVVWDDNRHRSGSESDIYFNCSLDGGASWLSSDMRLNTGAPGGARTFGPQIACDEAQVCAVWVDERGGAHDIYATACRP